MIQWASVDFPEPEGPTIRTFSPGMILRLMSRRVGSVCARYLKEKSLKYINEFENEYKSYYNLKKYFISNISEIVDFCNECYEDKDVFDYAEDVEYGLRELVNLSNKKGNN